MVLSSDKIEDGRPVQRPMWLCVDYEDHRGQDTDTFETSCELQSVENWKTVKTLGRTCV